MLLISSGVLALLWRMGLTSKDGASAQIAATYG